MFNLTRNKKTSELLFVFPTQLNGTKHSGPRLVQGKGHRKESKLLGGAQSSGCQPAPGEQHATPRPPSIPSAKLPSHQELLRLGIEERCREVRGG